MCVRASKLTIVHLNNNNSSNRGEKNVYSFNKSMSHTTDLIDILTSHLLVTKRSEEKNR